MQRVRVAGRTRRRSDVEGVARGHNAVVGQRVGRDDRGVAIHAADPLADVQVFQVIAHRIRVAVQAHLVGVGEERPLAVRVVALHAAHAVGVKLAGRRLEVRRVAVQVIVRPAHRRPALLEDRVVVGVSVGAVRPVAGNVQVALLALGGALRRCGFRLALGRRAALVGWGRLRRLRARRGERAARGAARPTRATLCMPCGWDRL